MLNCSRYIDPQRTIWGILFFGAVALPQIGTAQQVTAPAPDVFADLSYRHIGPVGNRVSAVAGVPGDPDTYFFGSASGGVFRSTDGGHQWSPVFDDQPVGSIGSIAIAPSDRNVVWVGTGESHIRSNVSIGNGIYRSTDGGDTWEHKGLDLTGRIARLAVHPDDPDVVYAAALETVERAGNTYSSSTRIRVRRKSSWTRTTRGSSSRPRGRC